MKRIALTLKSATIKNFKCITDKTIALKKLNEFYGTNNTGKSAILQAIQFCLVGGKNDVTKIKIGEEKAEVKVSLFSDQTPVNIKTTINQKGNVICTAEVNGVNVANPRTFIRKLLTYGTFNPREILEKKGRTARLLKLIPLSIKKEDLIIPGENKPFPIHDETEIDFDAHGFEVLQALDKDMRNVRLTLGQKKELLKKSYSEMKQTHEESIQIFKSNYGKDPLLDELPTYEETVSEREKLKAENKLHLDLYEELKENKKDLDNKFYKNQQALSGVKTNIHEKKEKIKKLQTEIEILLNQKENLEKEELDLKRFITTSERENASNSKAIEEFKSKYQVIEKESIMAKSASKIKEQEKFLDGKQQELEKAVMVWSVQDVLIKQKFPQFKAQVLSPLKKKVPGLDINLEGEFTLNDINVDELSGSEYLKLNIKFMSFDEKADLLFVNEAEALDSDGFKDIDWTNFNAFVARVADKPIGKGWNSVEMKKEKGDKA